MFCDIDLDGAARSCLLEIVMMMLIVIVQKSNEPFVNFENGFDEDGNCNVMILLDGIFQI